MKTPTSTAGSASPKKQGQLVRALSEKEMTCVTGGYGNADWARLIESQDRPLPYRNRG